MIPRHPFAVRTARMLIRDVGTTFAVIAYAKDLNQQVAVTEGEVSVAGTALNAHDVGTVDRAGRLTLRHEADVRPCIVVWSQGSLVFVRTPLRKVRAAVCLSRTYRCHRLRWPTLRHPWDS